MGFKGLSDRQYVGKMWSEQDVNIEDRVGPEKRQGRSGGGGQRGDGTA